MKIKIETTKTVVVTEIYEIDSKVYKEILKKNGYNNDRIQHEIESEGKCGNFPMIFEGIDQYQGYEVVK